jgi:mannose-6-phosphate isomerase
MNGLAEPIGEAWMTGNESRFANGPFKGQTLGEAWPEMPPEWLGTLVTRDPLFPLLVKFIFTEEKLSVQVHPDDHYAAEHERASGGRGKTEMWYALRARPGAEVLVGLRPDVTAQSFRRAIAEGTAEECLQHVRLSQGQAIFVPARTAHTIGAGLVLCEIQQQSDLTYRVYDYNRRDAQGRARELHIEKALAVMRFGPQKGGKAEPVAIKDGALTKTFIAACQYFLTERWDFAQPVEPQTSGQHFEILVALEGSGRIRFATGDVEYGPAQAWLLPAALGKFEMTPNTPTSLLRTYPPGSIEAAQRDLAAAGLAKSEISRLVHT